MADLDVIRLVVMDDIAKRRIPRASALRKRINRKGRDSCRMCHVQGAGHWENISTITRPKGFATFVYLADK